MDVRDVVITYATIDVKGMYRAPRHDMKWILFDIASPKCFNYHCFRSSRLVYEIQLPPVTLFLFTLQIILQGDLAVGSVLIYTMWNELCSFSNHSVTSATSQLNLQPFFRFSYVTGSSPGEPPMVEMCVCVVRCQPTALLYASGSVQGG